MLQSWLMVKPEVHYHLFLGGKTFTMGTALNTLDSDVSRGIIPRVIQEIFTQVKQREKKAEFIIKASFLQIYNEQIIDLLSDSISKSNKYLNINKSEISNSNKLQFVNKKMARFQYAM